MHFEFNKNTRMCILITEKMFLKPCHRTIFTKRANYIAHMFVLFLHNRKKTISTFVFVLFDVFFTSLHIFSCGLCPNKVTKAQICLVTVGFFVAAMLYSHFAKCVLHTRSVCIVI